MANMDLLSYERDSRWMPHLSWTFPDWTLQEKMAQQAAQREQAWQKIADKLGPLLVGTELINNNGGSSFGQSDFIVRDFEEQDYQERAYEKAPLLTAQITPQRHQRSNTRTRNSYRSINNNYKHQQSNNLKYIDSIDSLRPSQSPIFSEKESQSSGVDFNYVEPQRRPYYQNNAYLYHQAQQQQQQYDCESFQKAKKRCWTVSGILILLVVLLFTLVILMALGVIQYRTFPRVPL